MGGKVSVKRWRQKIVTLKSSITRERYGSATVGPGEAVVVKRVRTWAPLILNICGKMIIKKCEVKKHSITL